MLTFIVQRSPNSILDFQYQNKRLKLTANSTYIEDFEWYDDETKEANFSRWLDEMVGLQGVIFTPWDLREHKREREIKR